MLGDAKNRRTTETQAIDELDHGSLILVDDQTLFATARVAEDPTAEATRHGAMLDSLLLATHGPFADNQPLTLAEAETRTRGFALERHDRWLEGRGATPTPIDKYLVMEHEPMVGRISMILIPESLGR